MWYKVKKNYVLYIFFIEIIIKIYSCNIKSKNILMFIIIKKIWKKYINNTYALLFIIFHVSFPVIENVGFWRSVKIIGRNQVRRVNGGKHAIDASTIDFFFFFFLFFWTLLHKGRCNFYSLVLRIELKHLCKFFLFSIKWFS
jgi:hypothetical protein